MYSAFVKPALTVVADKSKDVLPALAPMLDEFATKATKAAEKKVRRAGALYQHAARSAAPMQVCLPATAFWVAVTKKRCSRSKITPSPT